MLIRSQLALKFCSAPSGSRPRKALFTCGLPTAWAGWQLALGERWRLLGGSEEVAVPADTRREAAWPGLAPHRALREGAQQVHPTPAGAGGLWPQGPKPSSGHRPRKMVTGRREDGVVGARPCAETRKKSLREDGRSRKPGGQVCSGRLGPGPRSPVAAGQHGAATSTRGGRTADS